MNILKYLTLGITVSETVLALISLLATSPVSGAAIVSVVQPAISAVETTFPNVKIPPQLVSDVANAAADAINTYYKPPAPPAAA